MASSRCACCQTAFDSLRLVSPFNAGILIPPRNAGCLEFLLGILIFFIPPPNAGYRDFLLGILIFSSFRLTQAAGIFYWVF
jgi:hypothetical protein